MVATTLPDGVIERIVEVLDPEEVWLFGSRARETHGPDSDWDLMAVLPNTAPDHQLDIAAVWADLRELRRLRIEVIPIRRNEFEENRSTRGELAEAVAREGHVVYGRHPPPSWGGLDVVGIAELDRRPSGLAQISRAAGVAG
jgi:predicted nucleotidyltransferase